MYLLVKTVAIATEINQFMVSEAALALVLSTQQWIPLACFYVGGTRNWTLPPLNNVAPFGVQSFRWPQWDNWRAAATTTQFEWERVGLKGDEQWNWSFVTDPLSHTTTRSGDVENIRNTKWMLRPNKQRIEYPRLLTTGEAVCLSSIVSARNRINSGRGI